MNKSILLTHTLLLAIMAIFTSCESIDLDGTNQEGDEKMAPLHIITRSASSEVSMYPLHIYVFSTEGKLLNHQRYENEAKDITFLLPKKEACKVVAVAADEQYYELPASPTTNDVIRIRQNSTIDRTTITPLQMGSASITTNGESTLRLQLTLQVASISASLSNMPLNCTEASIGIEHTYEGITLSGSYTGKSKAEIALSRNNGSWTTENAYIFPTTDQQTTFTIKYNDGSTTQMATATYKAPLKAGTPYNLTGNCEQDGFFELSGSVSPSEWAETVNLAFNFGNGQQTDIKVDGTSGGNTGGEGGNVETKNIPMPCTLYNGHMVAAVVDAAGNSITKASEVKSHATYTILLISAANWENLTSAYHVSGTEAGLIAEAYTEMDLTDWTIPTEAEARLLTQSYHLLDQNEQPLLEKALADAMFAPIVLTDDKGENLRYLCENAEKTFTFKENRILAAGKTVKNYQLRLVKTIQLSAE